MILPKCSLLHVNRSRKQAFQKGRTDSALVQKSDFGKICPNPAIPYAPWAGLRPLSPWGFCRSGDRWIGVVPADRTRHPLASGRESGMNGSNMSLVADLPPRPETGKGASHQDREIHAVQEVRYWPFVAAGQTTNRAVHGPHFSLAPISSAHAFPDGPN